MSRIMAHMVPYFPNYERSLAVAQGLIDGGAAYLEVQFPFSDPTADGPAIQTACQQALAAGFTVDKGLRFVEEITARGVPVFVMTYASIVFARGVTQFLTEATQAGASGFILPDIPIDHDEGAYAAAERLGTTIMPVIVTTMEEERIDLLTRKKPEYIYVALRRGITGTRTVLDEHNLGFLDRLKPLGAKIMAGFGISEREQVAELEPHVHAAIVGSALVKSVSLHAAEPAAELRNILAEQVRSLSVDRSG